MQGEGSNLRRTGRRLPRALAAGAFLCLLGGLLAAPALATPTWLTPTDLSAAGQDAEAPQVALDASGNAVAVWARSDGSHTIIQTSTRPAGGAWGPALDLSAAGRNAIEPQVAVDAAGDAVAVWARLDGSHTIIQGAVRPAGGAWSSPDDLSEAEQNAEAPQVVIDGAGNAVTVWARYNGSKFIVQSASRPAGGAWSSPDDLSKAGQNAEAPQVAVDPAGDAVAVWSRFDGAKFIVQSASRPAGGAWSSPDDLSKAGQNAEAPQVAVDPAGDAVAVWSRFDGANTIIQSARRQAGGVWGSAPDLSLAGRDASEPQVAIDPAGNPVAVWARANGALTTIIQAASGSADGSWQLPVDISELVLISAETPQVAVDPAGNALAVWSRSEGTPSVVQGATRPAGGAWQHFVDLSVVGRNATEPQVGLAPSGDGVAVWARENGVNPIVQAIGFDGAGPQLHALSIPAAGTVHRPVSFSVSPFDAWSAIGPISWSFGDGESGGGGTVTHLFARPGVYQVDVTAADALGNPTGATGTVRIYPKASASRNVRVRGGRALLRLTCPSPAGCEGVLRLIAGVQIERHHRRVARRVQIGRTTFSIPGPTTTIVPVGLTPQGRELVRDANRSGVKAQLTGPGVRHRLVALFPPPRR